MNLRRESMEGGGALRSCATKVLKTHSIEGKPKGGKRIGKRRENANRNEKAKEKAKAS